MTAIEPRPESLDPGFDEIDKLRYRMDAIKDKEVLREVLAQTQRHHDSEERRFATLNQKAQLLLGQAGAAVTLAGIAGGALLANSSRIPAWFSVAMSLALAVVVLVGAVTTIKAALVLRISASAEITKANLVAAEATKDLETYRQFLVVHVWEVHAGLRVRLDSMANRLQSAQQWFVGFLVIAGLIGTVLALLPTIIHGTK